MRVGGRLVLPPHVAPQEGRRVAWVSGGRATELEAAVADLDRPFSRRDAGAPEARHVDDQARAPQVADDAVARARHPAAIGWVVLGQPERTHDHPGAHALAVF